MNALADAAFLSRPTGELLGFDPHTAAMNANGYGEAELQAMGMLHTPSTNLSTSSALQGVVTPSLSMQGGAQMRGLVPPSQLPQPGRHLQILDHTVHRIDAHMKANGEEEKEMVVSNLRHFNLKIGVIDPRMGMGRDAELPLRAELLYENGQLVEQLATCEPLLVGKTEVVAMQGSALFKLRITSLSSHRDKQRFRIRISPVDSTLLLREPGLSVVTTPMKCVTKLSHRSSGSGTKAEAEVEDGEEEWAEGEAASANGTAVAGGKRKRDDLEALLEAQGAQLAALQKTNAEILQQLHQLKVIIAQMPSAPSVPP